MSERPSEAFGARGISRDVLDRMLEACQVIGFDWRYLYVNDVVVAQSRKSRDELVGRTMMECYPGIETTQMFAHLRKAMLDRTLEQMENEFSFPDGARVVFELRFIPVPEGVCVLSLDITERRHQLAAIVNDSADAIIGRTLEGAVTSWNKSAERIFGRTAAEMHGMTMGVLFPPELKESEAALAARVAGGERIEPFETVRLGRDGHPIDVSVTLSPVRDAEGTIIGTSTIARDITELKRTQRELVEAKETAESASRELESFSYSVAHDLRTPLRGIDGFSHALLEDYGHQLDERGRRYLKRVRDAAQRMAQLIDDMLMLSRVTRSEPNLDRVDLSALARAAHERLAGAEPERVVEVIIQNGLLVHADPQLMAVVLDNLFSNAWKFTSKCAAARIEFGAVAEQGGLAYFVRDNGAGFDMAYYGKLFGVFQRLHANHEFEGTGVGLATVQRIIHRHGGRAWAKGQVDGGATFYFTVGTGSGVVTE